MWTYEDVIPPIIANTTMRKGFLNGVHKIYDISPIDGYVLHDASGDFYDEETGETTLSFASGTVSCGASYDFTVNPREFYAIPEESHIYGIGNDHVTA